MFNNSQRPVDALAVKTSLAHLLTTWNQEMLAHLKMSICSQVCRVVEGKVTGACVRDAIDGGDAVSGRGRWKFCIAFYLMIIMILIMTPSRWSRSLQLLYRGPIWKLTADRCSAQCTVFKLTTLEAFKLRRPVSTRIVLELIELVAGFVWPDNCGVNCK